MRFVEDPNRPLLPDNQQPSQPRYLEIDTAFRKRWVSRITYGLFFALVAGVLMLLMFRFTHSKALAIGLVCFMVAYMAIMGTWASKNLEQRERQDQRWH